MTVDSGSWTIDSMILCACNLNVSFFLLSEKKTFCWEAIFFIILIHMYCFSVVKANTTRVYYFLYTVKTMEPKLRYSTVQYPDQSLLRSRKRLLFLYKSLLRYWLKIDLCNITLIKMHFYLTIIVRYEDNGFRSLVGINY